ncbi:hypothetical protein K466DRAFT_583968 [Polyporus arcularius HHB13444]|uniref:Uncharacterized protein n=1 Tax=Polyporus arcularius HHB13444 TaxID=1314778 RepID=A0A5C3PK72_9APHY|nr:hypothetical protein K466DRAFT_583968 [Polyporus arcularius HHB13444]
MARTRSSSAQEFQRNPPHPSSYRSQPPPQSVQKYEHSARGSHTLYPGQVSRGDDIVVPPNFINPWNDAPVSPLYTPPSAYPPNLSDEGHGWPSSAARRDAISAPSLEPHRFASSPYSDEPPERAAYTHNASGHSAGYQQHSTMYSQGSAVDEQARATGFPPDAMFRGFPQDPTFFPTTTTPGAHTPPSTGCIQRPPTHTGFETHVRGREMSRHRVEPPASRKRYRRDMTDQELIDEEDEWPLPSREAAHSFCAEYARPIGVHAHGQAYYQNQDTLASYQGGGGAYQYGTDPFC